MGYAINVVNSFGAPFQRVQEQIVHVPAQGWQTTINDVRKILFVLSGECRHRIVGWEGQWSDVFLQPGDILSLPHTCEQHYYTQERGIAKRLNVIRLSFNPTLLPALSLRKQVAQGDEEVPATTDTVTDLTFLANRSLQEIHFLRGAAMDAAIQETLAQLRDESRRRAPEYKLRVYGLCTGLTVLYARKTMEGRPITGQKLQEYPAMTYHVGRIKELLRIRLSHPPTLGEIAAHICLSEEHTARIFRKVTGVTISEYSRRLRAAEAKSLLATTDKNLGEIARLCGYESLTVFSRNFKREESVTPSEFRREIARQMG